MDCFLRDTNVIRIKKPKARVVKTGYLKIYEPGGLCDGWNSRFFVLFEDSSFLWHKDHNSYHHKGGIKLKMVANYMAVGPMCFQTSKFPKLPKGRQVIHLMGIPNIFKRGTRKENIIMNWILFDGGDEEMKSWLDAIKVTLPPPPPRPERHYLPSNAQPSTPLPSHNVTNYHPPLIVHTDNTFGGNEANFATGMLVGAAVGYGLGGYGPGMGWGWGWGWGPNPYSGYWGGWDEGGTADIDYADHDFSDDMDYGYADSDVGEFEAGDNGDGGDFGGFYGGDGGGYADEYGGGDGGDFAGNDGGGYTDNYAEDDGGGGDFGGDGGGCGGGCGEIRL